MSGKIVLNLAISVDGYIADEDGCYDWIVGHPDSKLDTENQFDFTEFVNEMDVVVMGKRCYEQGFHKDFAEKEVYVASTDTLEDYDNLRFINGDIVTLITKLKVENKKVYLFGGGGVVDHFIKKDVIDEYIIGIIPTILGSGRPLFLENNPTIKLQLADYYVKDGIVVMKYVKHY